MPEQLRATLPPCPFHPTGPAKGCKICAKTYALVSLELLYHMRCCHCDGWWNLADYAWPQGLGYAVVCPYCGKENRLPANPLLGEDFDASNPD